MNQDELILDFVKKCLDDDYGVSESASLRKFTDNLRNLDLQYKLDHLLAKIDATDGRFYLRKEK